MAAGFVVKNAVGVRAHLMVSAGSHVHDLIKNRSGEGRVHNVTFICPIGDPKTDPFFDLQESPHSQQNTH